VFGGTDAALVGRRSIVRVQALVVA